MATVITRFTCSPGRTGSGLAANCKLNGAAAVTTVAASARALSCGAALSKISACPSNSVPLANPPATCTVKCRCPFWPAPTVPKLHSTQLPLTTPPSVADRNVVFCGTRARNTVLGALTLAGFAYVSV